MLQWTNYAIVPVDLYLFFGEGKGGFFIMKITKKLLFLPLEEFLFGTKWLTALDVCKIYNICFGTTENVGSVEVVSCFLSGWMDGWTFDKNCQKSDKTKIELTFL